MASTPSAVLPSSVASSLPGDILASVLSHYELPEDEQATRHALNLVSRHWYTATRHTTTYVVTRAAQAAQLVEQLQAEDNSRVVRTLYLTCTEPGGFKDAHEEAYVDFLDDLEHLTLSAHCFEFTRSYLMRILTRFDHVRYLDISDLLIFTETITTRPPSQRAPLQTVRVPGNNLDDFLRWLFKGGPDIRDRDVIVGAIRKAKQVTALTKGLESVASEITSFQCFTILSDALDEVDCSPLFNSFLRQLTSITTLHISYGRRLDNLGISDALASLPTLRNLILRVRGSNNTAILTEFLSKSTIFSLTLEWTWYEGPSLDAFREVRDAAVAKGIEFDARRVWAADY
ncbi:hypothetical protein RQP46_008722 [Phenoliferia psychrophenolica]